MQRIMRATAIVLLIVTLFYPLLAPPPHRIDEAHFQLITEGMTEAEVEAIFGVPAGSYDWARPQTDLIWLVAVAEMQQFEVPAELDHQQRRARYRSRHHGRVGQRNNPASVSRARRGKQLQRSHARARHRTGTGELECRCRGILERCWQTWGPPLAALQKAAAAINTQPTRSASGVRKPKRCPGRSDGSTWSRRTNHSQTLA